MAANFGDLSLHKLCIVQEPFGRGAQDMATPNRFQQFTVGNAEGHFAGAQSVQDMARPRHRLWH